MIPSLETWSCGQTIKPRIRVLEIQRLGQPTDPAIAWLLVEKTTAYLKEDSKESGPINEASISLSYQQIGPDRRSRSEKVGCFQGGYSRLDNAISLTSSVALSEGAIFLDLPTKLEGQHIGTYMLNEIVLWAKQWPGAKVVPINLISGQAHGDNKERRNHFYEQFGLEFDYTGPDRTAGQSRPMLAGELHPVETWQENITEHHLMDFLVDTLNTREMALSELEFRDRAVRELMLEQRQAEAHPFFWTLKTLGGKCLRFLS
jgi:hypothetical protein